ncbi:MAG: hypothetical protein ACLFMM_03080 [Methanohalobium sp.]|uniref:hypothetical protein n=1 Tax=Methanohalobium sp. TaxID=2837493 RepID=UPI003978E3CC
MDIENTDDEQSISKFLEHDSSVLDELESLYNLEDEYDIYLDSVEFSIAHYYCNKNSELKDDDITTALQNIKENYDSNIELFNDLEKDIIENLMDTIKKEPITHHEFKLVIDYILWSIENRSWMEDNQAYAKWVSYYCDAYTSEEEEDYKKEIKKKADEIGLSQEDIDTLLSKQESLK